MTTTQLQEIADSAGAQSPLSKQLLAEINRLRSVLAQANDMIAIQAQALLVYNQQQILDPMFLQNYQLCLDQVKMNFVRSPAEVIRISEFVSEPAVPLGQSGDGHPAPTTEGTSDFWSTPPQAPIVEGAPVAPADPAPPTEAQTKRSELKKSLGNLSKKINLPPQGEFPVGGSQN